MKKIIAVLSAFMLVMLAVAQPASAHYVEEDPITYEGGGHCVQAWVEISHGTGKGYTKSEVESWADSHCVNKYHVPPNSMYVQPQVWQDNGATDWKCSDWGKLYNPNTTWRVTFDRTFAAVPSGGSCTGTSDWYGTYSGGYVKINGVWRGGWVFSGWHMLPATPGNEPLEGVEPDQRPALDPWVDPVTMIVDLSMVPDDRFPVPEPE